MMRYRRLGTRGLRVSALFLGAMTFGEEAGPGALICFYVERTRCVIQHYLGRR